MLYSRLLNAFSATCLQNQLSDPASYRMGMEGSLLGGEETKEIVSEQKLDAKRGGMSSASLMLQFDIKEVIAAGDRYAR
jgi:hypothetical protein